MAGKIMFRGDGRHPLRDNMFVNGFGKWEPAMAITYRNAGPNMSGDLDPESGVCVAARFEGAVLFPLKFSANEPRIRNYVYAVYVDTGHLFNTHQRQVADSLGSVIQYGGHAVWHNPNQAQNAQWSTNSPMWPLFAHEMAVDSIPGTNVIACVSCDRRWNGPDWSYGGDYTLGTVWENQGCTVLSVYRTLAVQFLRDEVQNHSPNQLPGGSTGYHVSNPRSA